MILLNSNPWNKHYPCITLKMRQTCVEWMIDVQKGLHLNIDIIYMSVHLLDRYVAACDNIMIRYLQFIGATCIFIACKYYEDQPLTTFEIEYLCANSYSKKKICRMERRILKKLNYELVSSTRLSCQLLNQNQFIICNILMNIEYLYFNKQEIENAIEQILKIQNEGTCENFVYQCILDTKKYTWQKYFLK